MQIFSPDQQAPARLRKGRKWRGNGRGDLARGARLSPDWTQWETGGDPDRDWPLLPVIAAYVCCFLLMTWPWVMGYVTIPWDAKAHFQPQIQFLADSLARGEWPWWNPFVFAGTPPFAARSLEALVAAGHEVALVLTQPDRPA